MPTYEYLCNECGNVIEEYEKISRRRSAVDCPCGGNAARIVSRPSIQSDNPLWLDDHVRGSVQDPADRKIENRTELNRYLKEKDFVCIG